MNVKRSFVPTTTKTQKKKKAAPASKVGAVKRTVRARKTVRKTAAKRVSKRIRKPAAYARDQGPDETRVHEHLSALRNISDLPPINLDDLIRSEEPMLFAAEPEPIPNEPLVTLRSRISFYLGVFFGAVVVHVLVVVFLTAVSV